MLTTFYLKKKGGGVKCFMCSTQTPCFNRTYINRKRKLTHHMEKQFTPKWILCHHLLSFIFTLKLFWKNCFHFVQWMLMGSKTTLAFTELLMRHGEEIWDGRINIHLKTFAFACRLLCSTKKKKGIPWQKLCILWETCIHSQKHRNVIFHPTLFFPLMSLLKNFWDIFHIIFICASEKK